IRHLAGTEENVEPVTQLFRRSDGKMKSIDEIERTFDILVDRAGDQPPPIGWRDPLGASHHEGGTLFMRVNEGDDSITNTFGRMHHLSNVYVAGPALFPTVGSANPSLAGLALARRTAAAIAEKHVGLDTIAVASMARVAEGTPAWLAKGDELERLN